MFRGGVLFNVPPYNHVGTRVVFCGAKIPENVTVGCHFRTVIHTTYHFATLCAPDVAVVPKNSRTFIIQGVSYTMYQNATKPEA